MGLVRIFGHTACERYRLLPLLFVLSSQIAAVADEQTQPKEIVEQFKAEPVFWKQMEIGQKIVLAKDARVLPLLEPWLQHPDRHIRGNTAFIFGGLGDARGLDVVFAILDDRSDRPEGQAAECMTGNGTPCWSLPRQIAADRYYAVHLLGLLKDPRAVPILESLLDDPDVNYKIPWALGNIGGRSAIEGLITALQKPSPQVRVYAIEQLKDLKASEALSALLPLLSDHSTSPDGITVSEAARLAIARLQGLSDPAR